MESDLEKNSEAKEEPEINASNTLEHNFRKQTVSLDNDDKMILPKVELASIFKESNRPDLAPLNVNNRASLDIERERKNSSPQREKIRTPTVTKEFIFLNKLPAFFEKKSKTFNRESQKPLKEHAKMEGFLKKADRILSKDSNQRDLGAILFACCRWPMWKSTLWFMIQQILTLLLTIILLFYLKEIEKASDDRSIWLVLMFPVLAVCCTAL